MATLQLDIDSIAEEGIDEKTALCVLACPENVYYSEVMPVASALRERTFGNRIGFCSITNAKSGACAEECKFCAQSASYNRAEAPLYGLKSADQIFGDAQSAEQNGATEFSIVTSGRRISKKREMDELVKAVERISSETGMETCASLGLMEYDDLKRLKEAGMVNYHHNIETARSHFANIVTTHTFDDEVKTLKAARKAGLRICCGGILGMGETLSQRVEFAFDLKEINPDSASLNFLNPRPGTPLYGINDLKPLDCLKSISMLRMVLPKTEIFVCGGREVNMGSLQDEMFSAGATGTMLGHYLTTRGRSPEEDLQMAGLRGFKAVKNKVHPIAKGGEI